jgi:hypothetical protein
MPGTPKHRKNSNKLAYLDTPVRFQNPKIEKKHKNSDSYGTSLEPASISFLKKRSRLDSIGLFDIPDNKDKGMKEIYVTPKHKNSDVSATIFRKRRSSALLVKENHYIPFFDEEEEKDIEAAWEDDFRKKTLAGRKRKNKDDFDFNMDEDYNQKGKRFIIKCNKDSKEIEINEQDGKIVEVNQPLKEPSKCGKTNEDEQETFETRWEIEEAARLKIKIKKVKLYWARDSILIPNALRLSHLIEEDQKNLLEFQDYSQKSVLVQGQSNKQRIIKEKDNDEDEGVRSRRVSFAHRRSFNIMLNVPDDLHSFFDI